MPRFGITFDLGHGTLSTAEWGTTKDQAVQRALDRFRLEGEEHLALLSVAEYDTPSVHEPRCPNCGAWLEKAILPRIRWPETGWTTICPTCGVKVAVDTKVLIETHIARRGD